MTEPSKVTPISDPAKAIDDLRAQVASITKAVESIRKSGITEAALLALLVHACPPIASGTGYGKVKLSARTIKSVLAGMQNLDAFVFGQKAKK